VALTSHDSVFQRWTGENSADPGATMFWHEGSYTWPPVPGLPNASATTPMTEDNNTATDVVAPTPATVPDSAAYLRAMNRKRELEADVWAGEVTATTVQCRACEHRVQLDHRDGARYYQANWTQKHSGICPKSRDLRKKYPTLEVIDSFVCSDPSRTRY
jgi:hypothetical protein